MTDTRNLHKIETLVGLHFFFHGAENNTFYVSFDGLVFGFEVLEDPRDGYRSSMDCVKLVMAPNSASFREPIAEVTLVAANETTSTYSDGPFNGYDLVDTKTGHRWLRFGTDYRDEWYPCFVFDYEPDKSQVIGDN